MKKYRSYKGEIGKIAPNLLDRNFRADRPLQKLATDVTEFSLFGVKRYLSPVFDMFNGEIIHYTLYEHPVLDMVLEMTEETIKKNRPENRGDTTFRPRMGISAQKISTAAQKQWNTTKHVEKRKLPGQLHDGELLRTTEVRTVISSRLS